MAGFVAAWLAGTAELEGKHLEVAVAACVEAGLDTVDDLREVAADGVDALLEKLGFNAVASAIIAGNEKPEPAPKTVYTDRSVTVTSSIDGDRLDGVYREMTKRPGTLLYCKKKKRYFVKDKKGRWCFQTKQETNSCAAYGGSEAPDATNPSEIEGGFKVYSHDDHEWQEADIELEWSEEPAEESEPEWPAVFVVACRYGNINGGYVKTDEEKGGCPVYHNEEDDKKMAFSSGSSKWKIYNMELGGSYMSSEVVESPGVTEPDDVRWDGMDVDEWEEPAEDGDVTGCTFVDEEFPPEIDSINTGIDEDSVKWVRAELICRDPDEGKTRLFNKIEPNDICQGAIGDCWLMAAISSVAEFPSFVKDELFKGETEVNEDGQYTVKLWDIGPEPGAGEWVDVTVDSFIPCHSGAFCRKPMFAGVKDNEMYMMILEKAFAKFAGNYQELKGGWAYLAWCAMTGCEKIYSFKKHKNDEGETWEPRTPNMRKRYENPREFNKLWTTSTDDYESMDHDAFWEFLKESDEANHILGASISGDVMEKARSDGLVERHAYSLLAAKEVEDTKLVCLRNPWGNSREWNGAWCDGSAEWGEHPEVAEEIGHSSGADGKFWMSFDDFARIWSTRC